MEDWVQLHSLLRASKQAPVFVHHQGAGAALMHRLESSKGKIAVMGTAGTNAQHTINEDERRSFTDHINGVLAQDKDVGHLLPIPTDTMQLFDECKGMSPRDGRRLSIADGLILCKLINDSVPETIDERVLNKGKGGKAINAFQMTENNNIVISSSKGIGCSVVNIGPSDIAEGREHLILGLIWQVGTHVPGMMILLLIIDYSKRALEQDRYQDSSRAVSIIGRWRDD